MICFADQNVKLYHGDLLEWLPSLTESPRFLFADPPFNIGQAYGGYDDEIDWHKFFPMLDKWILATAKACDSSSSMAWHVPDRLARHINSIEEQLSDLNMIPRDWIIWHYRFGQCGRSKWINSKCHCLVYGHLSREWTWNPHDVLVESDRSSTYGDKRINETEHGGSRVPFDVWGIPSDGEFWGRVQGNNAERVKGRPNQLPERYLERLIRAYTNPGDLVCDPFCGTGTTAVVALALGRRFVGGDIDAGAIAATIDRINKGAVRL